MKVAAVLILAVALYAPPVLGQLTVRSVEFDDLGLTEPLTPGARPAALAGTYTTVGNDVHSLVYNPAGLAAIKRIEGAAGIAGERREATTTFYGEPSPVDNTAGSLDAASVAFPFPVIRGSLVGAAGVYRLFSSANDLAYSGTNGSTNTTDDYLLQQTGAIYAYHVGFGADLAHVISGGASVFLLDGTINSLQQYDFTFLAANPSRSVFVVDEVKQSVSGYGARLGVLFHSSPGLRVGAVVTTPIVVNASGDGITEVTEHVDNAVDRFVRTDTEVETDYLLPLRFDFGVSGTWRAAMLSVDVGYSDWTTAAIERTRLRTRELQTVFREVLEIKVGTEVTLPRVPVRLRAGYARLPYPLRYLPSDRIELQELERVHIDKERERWALGAGVLIGRLLTVDAAYTYTSGERSVENYSQRNTTHRVVLTAACRF